MEVLRWEESEKIIVSESLNYVWLNIQTFLSSLTRKHTYVLSYKKVTLEAVGDRQHRVTELSARRYPKYKPQD